jgi:hypothetical protein
MTVVSENHYDESIPMLGTVINEYPGSKVIYFDAGLKEQQVSKRSAYSVIYLTFLGRGRKKMGKCGLQAL